MVFNQHLELEPVLYYHDMYMRLFHQFFDGELKSLSREKRNNLMYFINEGNYTKALEAIELLYTKRIDLRELVLIKSLTEAYISNECEKAGIVSILNAIAETSRFEHNKTIAKNTLHTLTRLDVGQKAPSFRFQTEQGEIKSISDFKGKYVYINFVAAWCSECLTELQAIKGVQERYGDMVEFVTIFVDEDLQRFKRYITSNSFKWHVAHFNYSYELLSLYNVKTLPSYYLIDVEGNLLQSPALKPIPKGNSPSVDFTFFNIKKGGKK
jgi:thiol-disulfide isomerase/thioredoxin